jgi:hypothetical protein
VRQRVTPGGMLDIATTEEIQVIMEEAQPRGDRGRESGYSGLYDVVMGDFDHPEPVLLVSPPARRLRITRHGGGGEAITVTTAISSVLAYNEGRMGLTIVNYGANNVFLYLSNINNLQGPGPFTVPVIWLKSAGGSWGGAFSEGLWGGSVCAKCDAATSTLAVAEI